MLLLRVNLLAILLELTVTPHYAALNREELRVNAAAWRGAVDDEVQDGRVREEMAGTKYSVGTTNHLHVTPTCNLPVLTVWCNDKQTSQWEGATKSHQRCSSPQAMRLHPSKACSSATSAGLTACEWVTPTQPRPIRCTSR